MIEPWQDLIVQSDASPGGRFAAEVRVAPDSPWFDGHFPGRPVLPGVAILSMVCETVRRAALEQGRPVRISGIRRVRFRRPVRPDERLSIEIRSESPEMGNGYLFQAEVDGELACTGLVSVEPAAAGRA